jgi:hypothetical protein
MPDPVAPHPPAEVASPTGPPEGVAALRAEQQKLNGGEPRFVEISKQIEDAYKAKYPPPTTEPDAAPRHASGTERKSPSTLLDGVPAIRKELESVNAGSPRFKELMQELEGAYKTAYPAPAVEPDPAVASIAERQSALEDAIPAITDENRHAAWIATATTPRHDGEQWNREIVAQVHALMGAHLDSAASAELFQYALPILNAAHAQIARGLQVSPESTEALMLEEWGDEWDRKTLAAEAAWSKLPPAEQREWTRSKLRYHPNVWRFLASVGERLKKGA